MVPRGGRVTVRSSQSQGQWSGQQIHSDMGESGQPVIVGQERVAATLSRCGQMQRVLERVTPATRVMMNSADVRGPFTDWGCHRDEGEVPCQEETLVTEQRYSIS